MAATLLGKRTRSATAAAAAASSSAAADTTSTTATAKRRLAVNGPDEENENENPFVSRRRRRRRHGDHEMPLDASEPPAKRTRCAAFTTLLCGEDGGLAGEEDGILAGGEDGGLAGGEDGGHAGGEDGGLAGGEDGILAGGEDGILAGGEDGILAGGEDGGLAGGEHPAHASVEEGAHLSPALVKSHFRVRKSGGGRQERKRDHDKENVPQTPRHRDALSKKVPVTPRHRGLASQATPRSARTPSTPSHASVYHQARRLFARCSDPGQLVGREHERGELSAFVSAAIGSKASGCLYVSGPPGTGKSALLSKIVEEQTADCNVPRSVVNCMSVRSTKDLSQKLSDDLDLRADAGFDYLKSVFVRGNARDKKKYLVVLDEVDVLVDLDLELLYSLFEWSMQPTSRLILIGIANALDLTDRFLPRLKARNLKPDLLPFMPYTAAQIAEVITSKLRSLAPADSTALPFLHPAAIQFCAKKVAAQTGDLRKAFDICKRAIDLIDTETRDNASLLELSPSKTPLMENVNLSSPTGSPKKKSTTVYTVETAPKATIAHMAKVTAQAFSHGTTQRLGSLNLQQKAVLCALAALERKKRDTQLDRTMFATPSKSNCSAPSIKQLYDAYSTLCKREHLFHALSAVEFRDVVSGLETLSLVNAVDGGKNGSFALLMTPSRTPGRPRKHGFAGPALTDERRVASCVALKELDAALDGPAGELLKEMLVGGALA